MPSPTVKCLYISIDIFIWINVACDVSIESNNTSIYPIGDITFKGGSNALTYSRKCGCILLSCREILAPWYPINSSNYSKGPQEVAV